MPPRLFHYSELDNIEQFVPRPVQIPSKRKDGFEWLNGPLVWAIDQWHQPLYLFPRECPRILIWCTEQTKAEDAEHYFSQTEARMIAYVEKKWMSKFNSATLHRYELPQTSFRELFDAGMWVSDKAVLPVAKARIDNLGERLLKENVELRVLDQLTPLRDAWNSSLHVSGIRLRNAKHWA